MFYKLRKLKFSVEFGRDSFFSNVVWQSTDGTGFELFYPNIQLHAISRDKNAFLKDCLYLMVEGNVLPVSASSNRDMQMVQPVAEDANSDDEDQVNLDVEDDMCCEVRNHLMRRRSS